MSEVVEAVVEEVRRALERADQEHLEELYTGGLAVSLGTAGSAERDERIFELVRIGLVRGEGGRAHKGAMVLQIASFTAEEADELRRLLGVARG